MAGSPVRRVYLSSGSFGDAGVTAFAESIGKNKMNWLYLEGAFGEAGLTELKRVANASGLTVHAAWSQWSHPVGGARSGFFTAEA